MNKDINEQKHKRQTEKKCFVIPFSNHSVEFCFKEVVDNNNIIQQDSLLFYSHFNIGIK
jgi:hypothetical protein